MRKRHALGSFTHARCISGQPVPEGTSRSAGPNWPEENYCREAADQKRRGDRIMRGAFHRATLSLYGVYTCTLITHRAGFCFLVVAGMAPSGWCLQHGAQQLTTRPDSLVNLPFFCGPFEPPRSLDKRYFGGCREDVKWKVQDSHFFRGTKGTRHFFPLRPCHAFLCGCDLLPLVSVLLALYPMGGEEQRLLDAMVSAVPR